MSHANLSIFIPHVGCPCHCSFCDQNTISGVKKAPTVEEVAALLEEALPKLKDPGQTEIAYFGGSFTAVERGYMVALLRLAARAVQRFELAGIRLSTRPDALGEEVIARLKEYGVTAVELGVQSMDNEVLLKNRRGHDRREVQEAAARLHAAGIQLGVQMMPGLPGDSEESTLQTAQELIALRPETVRIYPALVLEHTLLARWYREGSYQPLSLEQAVETCCKLIPLFEEAGVKIIKLGLHASEMVEGSLVAGPYHPAFRQLCQSRLLREQVLRGLRALGSEKATIWVSPRMVSDLVGQKKSNLPHFQKAGFHVTIKVSSKISGYEVRPEG